MIVGLMKASPALVSAAELSLTLGLVSTGWIAPSFHGGSFVGYGAGNRSRRHSDTKYDDHDYFGIAEDALHLHSRDELVSQAASFIGEIVEWHCEYLWIFFESHADAEFRTELRSNFDALDEIRSC
jgi:hypothetical protein